MGRSVRLAGNDLHVRLSVKLPGDLYTDRGQDGRRDVYEIAVLSGRTGLHPRARNDPHSFFAVHVGAYLRLAGGVQGYARVAVVGDDDHRTAIAAELDQLANQLIDVVVVALDGRSEGLYLTLEQTALALADVGITLEEISFLGNYVSSPSAASTKCEPFQGVRIS